MQSRTCGTSQSRVVLAAVMQVRKAKRARSLIFGTSNEPNRIQNSKCQLSGTNDGQRIALKYHTAVGKLAGVPDGPLTAQTGRKASDCVLERLQSSVTHLV